MGSFISQAPCREADPCLIVGEELEIENSDAMELRGSELLGNRDGILFPRYSGDNGGEQTSQENL